MANVLVNDASLADIADAIREKNGTEETYKPAEMGAAVRGLQSGGGSSENAVWQYATFDNGQAFRNATFPDDYKAEVKILGHKNGVALGYFFFNSNISNISLEIENNEVTVSANSIFNACQSLKNVEFKNTPFKINNGASMFGNCKILENIYGVLDISSANNVAGMFGKCNMLKEVRFANETIKVSLSLVESNLLSDDTVQSIIDGLMVVTTAQTLTLHADVKAKLTEAQIATITGKNWTLA